jgi:hypothetical protein
MIYRSADERLRARSSSDRKQSYLRFKVGGPPVDDDRCPECSGLTEFQGGFISCTECGWTEGVIETWELMGRYAA